MNNYYWNHESWGSEELPADADEIIAEANERIEAFIEKNELDPENSEVDAAILTDYCERLWEAYCERGELIWN